MREAVVVRSAAGLSTVLAFRILGPLEVIDRERRVVVGGPKQRALLAVLLLCRGEVLSSDRLIDQLWGARPPATAAKTLQGYVSHLRKALGNEVLLTRGGGYLLAVAPAQVDAERFEALAAEASPSTSRSVCTATWSASSRDSSNCTPIVSGCGHS